MNDWIEWNGGECPVDNGVKVQYVLRDGMRLEEYGHLLAWGHSDGNSDIIAYRIVETTQVKHGTDVTQHIHNQKCENDFTQPASKKYDTDKPELSYIDEYFPNALNGVQAVNKFGAEKYGWHTWQGVDNAIMRYKHALRRHQLALASGEKCDPESGLRHEYHIAWNALSIAELETKKAIKED